MSNLVFIVFIVAVAAVDILDSSVCWIPDLYHPQVAYNVNVDTDVTKLMEQWKTL